MWVYVTRVFHSTYKGHRIYKVTQASGRITWDICDSSDLPWEWAAYSLRVAKAIIDAELGFRP